MTKQICREAEQSLRQEQQNRKEQLPLQEQQNRKEQPSLQEQSSGKRRLHLLDGIRGITLVSMLLYHAVWDLVYLYDRNWSWYQGNGAYIWQQSICWTFIFLSGFCWSLGKHPVKRGLTVFAGGALVTAVTLLFMPENRVIFGVLTLIGSGMLLLALFHRTGKRVPAGIGLCGSLFLFFLTRNVNVGSLGFEGLSLAALPEGLYRNLFSAFLGFPSAGFYSTDYFSLFPWLFLFISGYYAYFVLQKRGLQKHPAMQVKIPFLDFLGRHSLLLYLVHQPVLYGIFELGMPLLG